ncbi:MAG: biopolymer transporter ExbD, partial [Lysobacteraceae bacterium]
PLNLRGDRTTKMRTINEVTKIAQEQGMLDIGFVATKDRSQ